MYDRRESGVRRNDGGEKPPGTRAGRGGGMAVEGMMMGNKVRGHRTVTGKWSEAY